jgi:hypothetical protein
MATNNYTTTTAALKATKADVRNLNASAVKVKGKDVVIGVKHHKDTRETVTENDLWGQWTEVKNGEVVVHEDYIVNPGSAEVDKETDSGSSEAVWDINIVKVQDNKAYTYNDAFWANVQTERLINAAYMFTNVGSLQTFDSDMPALVDGYSMFNNATSLTTFSADLSSLEDGSFMFFSCSSLNSIKTSDDSTTLNLCSLKNAKRMFSTTGIASFNANLPSLVDGSYMFASCTGLTSFIGDLPHMTNGSNMFNRATSFATFSADSIGTPVNLSSLTDGNSMFYSTKITKFDSELPSLIQGYRMFYNVSGLDSYTGNLNSLINGEGMFYGNKALTNFTSMLCSLTSGYQMFQSAKLSPDSVLYIVESLKNINDEKALYTSGAIPYVVYNSSEKSASAPSGFTSDNKYVFTTNGVSTTISANNVGRLTLGINVSSAAVDGKDTATQLAEFAAEIGYKSWADLKQEFIDKGWNVTFQYGGSSTSITLPEMEGIGKAPIYAKLIFVEDPEAAEYCTEDGTAFYDIDWGHDVTNPTEYQYFGSLLEACGHFGVVPKEYV